MDGEEYYRPSGRYPRHCGVIFRGAHSKRPLFEQEISPGEFPPNLGKSTLWLKLSATARKLRHALERGVNQLADTVKITMGPKGRKWCWTRSSAPRITNDGVTIAKGD